MRWSEKRNVTGIRRHMIRGAGIHDLVSDSRRSEAHGAEGVGQSLLIPGAGPGRLGRGLVHLLLRLLLVHGKSRGSQHGWKARWRRDAVGIGHRHECLLRCRVTRAPIWRRTTGLLLLLLATSGPHGEGARPGVVEGGPRGATLAAIATFAAVPTATMLLAAIATRTGASTVVARTGARSPIGGTVERGPPRLRHLGGVGGAGLRL